MVINEEERDEDADENEIQQREYFRKHTMPMLEDHCKEWLERQGMMTDNLRETILLATTRDINALERHLGQGITLPKKLGEDLNIQELVECITRGIDWLDVFGIQMLLSITPGNRDIIYDDLLEEGRERMTVLQIEMDQGEAGSAMYRAGQLLVLFWTLHRLQEQ